MSNIHTLFDGKKDEENKKATTAYNGNGVASVSRDAMGLDGIVSKAKSGGPPVEGEKSDVKITLYSNGFTVDDGEFRDYADEANKAFMDEVKKGYVPKEL
jgi:UBX domain-containing protein 1